MRPAAAQETSYSLPTEKHARELAITTGIATDLPGGARGGNYWTAQLRLGRTLLAPPGLHGALEAAMELEPTMVLHQDGFLYGAGLTPVLLQWNVATGSRIRPFVNAGAGILLTSASGHSFATNPSVTGQVNAEQSGDAYRGGTGGQVDFVRAGTRSPGGAALMVLAATAKGGSISKIVPAL